ncbi:putative L-asparaginase [Paenibacillus sp. 598K]|nr:putative L-asparaginase [Paenibacillus sp. 598K]
MLNDVIFAAREVTKTNSHRMDTFDAPMFGALGYVDDPAVRIYRAPARAFKAGTPEWATPFDLKTISKDNLPLVGIVYNYQEASGGAIRGLVEDGVKGIVTAGTGAGGISSALSAARSAAITNNNVVFVSTTRTGSGSIYGGSGNTVAGDNLNAAHARIMLLLSLAFSNDVSVIRGWFQTFGTADVEISVDADTVLRTSIEEEPALPEVEVPVVTEPVPGTEEPAVTDPEGEESPATTEETEVEQETVATP